MTKTGLTLAHVGMGTGTHRPFDQIYPNSVMVKPEEIKDVKPDALVIWGGADISPSIYGDSVADMCGASSHLSYRDKLEVDACKQAIDLGIPVIGVCRGAQLVCALSGGRLIQHVDSHAGGMHDIDTYDGKTVRTSSVHHQMMYPFDVDHTMIAWSSENRSKRYIIGTNENDPEMEGRVEPEIVWFPRTRSLGIQGHPEFHSHPDKDLFVQYCLGLVKTFIIEGEE
jgi:anthranilate/para-aminobenzoate synthase component II